MTNKKIWWFCINLPWLVSLTSSKKFLPVNVFGSIFFNSSSAIHVLFQLFAQPVNKKSVISVVKPWIYLFGLYISSIISGCTLVTDELGLHELSFLPIHLELLWLWFQHYEKDFHHIHHQSHSPSHHLCPNDRGHLLKSLHWFLSV